MRTRPTRHAVAVLLSAAGLVTGGGLAAAQISPTALPGTNDNGYQVAVGTGLGTVVVNEAGAHSTEVTGTFKNESDDVVLGCTQGTVTDAALVNQSLAYMAENIVSFDSDDDVVVTGPGSVDAGSLGSLVPGHPAADGLAAIQQAQDGARLAGHYGPIRENYRVEPGEEIAWTATLTVPTGGRTDFNAAALFSCYELRGEESNYQLGQMYAFAGYEESDDQDNGNGGSMSMGFLGS